MLKTYSQMDLAVNEEPRQVANTHGGAMCFADKKMHPTPR